jgi:pyruvate dehydrogenase E1 component alpha subunit
MDFKKKIKQLIDFENKVANLFNNAKIYSPIHLYSNNEGKIIRIFEKINEKDWVFCSWRSHYQCLLKGVKKDRLLKEITKGKSISLCFPSKNVFSSAIVAGQIPIAIGVAWSIKIKKGKEKV